jgi:hypothetical protein
VAKKPAVIDVLRRFLPPFLATKPVLSVAQRRAIAAIRKCRTPALGGHERVCPDCKSSHFAWHSCNHKACPQCGRAATAQWIQRQLDKLTGAHYFMVTFTLPQELRDLFFGPQAKEAFDLFFAATSLSLAQTLAVPKYLGAHVSGFTAVLHTWTQQIFFHPHIHFIVPGAGLDAKGRICRVKKADYLVYLPVLQAAFKHAFRTQLELRQWEVDPAVWTKDWGVHIEPCGTGSAAVKYLGAYVARTAIADSRLVAFDDHNVSFAWKDRANAGRIEKSTITGVEFVKRYLRHVLPPTMHSVRHYGFCHPSAKKNRERVRFFTGMQLVIQSPQPPQAKEQTPKPVWPCPCCGTAMQLVAIHPRRRMYAPHPLPPLDDS